MSFPITYKILILKNREILTAIIVCILASVSIASAGVEVLTPRLSVSEEYTDNLFRTSTNKQEEFTTVISPGFDYSAEVREGGLSVSYTAGYAMYHKSAEDSFLRHDATVAIWSNPQKHTQTTFQNFFLWTDEPVQNEEYSLLGYVEYEDQLIPVLDTTLRTGLNEYITDTATANLIHQFGEDNSINFQGLVSFRKEIDNEFNNDNRRYEPSVSLTYWMTPNFSVDASAIYTRGVFVNSDNFNDFEGILTLQRDITRHINIFAEYDQMLRRYDGENSTDYDNYAGSGGISYESDNNITLTLGGGYFYQDLEEGDDPEGLFFNGSVDKTWTSPRSTARIVGSAGLDRNEFGTENIGLERFYALGTSASYRLSMRVTATFNASARISEHLNTDDNRTDYLGNVGLGLTYIPKTWLTIGTTYNHNLIRGRGDIGNYDVNTALLTVSLLPQGFRFK